MSLDRTFARIVTHHRLALGLAVVAMLIAALLTIRFRVHFASDVLDLLPQQFEAVKAFKVFDREFSQARELTIGLLDETGQVDLDAFSEHFSEKLREEPWIARVMDRSPLESPGGLEAARALALPLLLNLDTPDFDQALHAVAPDEIAARLKKLHGELEAGSPKAEFQLDFDPLGLVAPALKPLGSSFSIEQTRPLASPDGTLRIVLAKTKQTDLGAKTCQEIMDKVEDFKKRVLADWSGPAPKILVTGRTPYVGELSRTMGSDVISTVVGSVVLVTAVFLLGFRRIRPLFSIMVVLALCCVIAVALGALVFRELNMITIGLCSILIGLGVDFGMMLYAVYERERETGGDHEAAIAAAIRSQGKGVFFGSLTTAAAFLCFLRSQSTGFEQLGVLIAFGILCAGLFMATVFFGFIGGKFRVKGADWLWTGGAHFVRFVHRSPRAFFLCFAALLCGCAVFAFLPIGRVQFDANPRSLEPKDSRAGIALRTIQSKMPIAAEPVIVLLRSANAEQFHDGWAKLQASWTNLVAEKKIRSAASPAALAISPARLSANAARLQSIDFAASRTALTNTITAEGLSADAFKPAFATLDSLKAIAHGDRSALDWRQALPEDSTWWFVLDRFFSRDPNLGAAYITPNHTLSSFAEKEQLRKEIESAQVPVLISGWSYTLQDLVPWSKGKLTELSIIMVVFNVLLLLFLYRRAFPLFILMLSLALSIAALVTTLKLFAIPLNMFNVLAFPLVLGVGVDYGIYIVIAMRQEGQQESNLATVVKPVLLSGLCTTCGFGSLAFAANPALRSLGSVCAIGVAWCLFATLCFVLPAYAWRGAK
ncbi:putative RND superfamily exporter protein [Chthoniobacter flavus]|nr:MMPL family transporter [Chthoniobacter flavus]TCO95636.1 putative RND superfamily exporter protein [Chthoniobacter flavus]